MRLVHSFSLLEEICVLFDEADCPVCLSADRPDDLPVGTICSARAVKAVGTSWFVDIGQGVGGYMNAAPYYIKPDGFVCFTPLTEGDFLLVQVSRPAVENKENEVSAKISLPGKTVVFLPAEQTASFSRQLSEQARKRLAATFENKGFLLRTAAEKADVQTVVAEAEKLEKCWRDFCPADRKPGVLYRPEKTVFQWAELYQDALTEIVTDEAETAAKLKKNFSNVVFLPRGVWEKENIAGVVEEACSIKTSLPSGGSLITEQTAACVCFDVNAGKSPVATANTEACAEILRQIRLKGLGGQMIIDFAGRKEKKFLHQMISLLDSPDVYMGGYSPLGLIELTVEKKQKSVFDLFGPAGKTYETAATLVRKVWFCSASGRIEVFAPLSVLNILRPYLGQLENRLKTTIELKQAEEIKVEGIEQ